MSQSIFAQALLDPEAALPVGLTDPEGRPAPRRFSVYRNTVTSGLIRVLEAAFPVIRKLVGDEFFAAMALVFVRAHPPRTRLMMLYGAQFPGFLAAFPPVSHLGYLADVARLEQAIRESYHAADAPALPAEAFATLTDAQMMNAKLRLAPSLGLIRSPWPIHMIWRANSEAGPPPAPVRGAEDVLILREAFDPAVHLLPPGGGAFMTGLLAGQSLAATLAPLGRRFDLPAMLGLLIQGRAIVGMENEQAFYDL